MGALVRRDAVTGSQRWRDEWQPYLWSRLDERWQQTRPGEVYVIRHGGADDGADRHVHEWVAYRQANPDPRYARVEEEVVAADWENCDPASRACKPVKADGTPHRKPNPGWPHNPRRGGKPDYCPAAGHRRNPDVPAHPDHPVNVLHAFILDGSPGASATVKAADAAGVDSITYKKWSRKGRA